MKPERIRSFVKEERELRERIEKEAAQYEGENVHEELSASERFSGLNRRMDALPRMGAHDDIRIKNAKTLEVMIHDSEDPKDGLLLQLEINYFAPRPGQTEIGGTVLSLVAIWRDPKAAQIPILEQHVYGPEENSAGLSIIEDSVAAAEAELASV